MARLTLEKPKSKSAYPIAIIKCEKNTKSPYHNKFLYLNPDDKAEGETKITIPDDCVFNIIPSTDKDKRDVIYVAGASGSGKSYQAKIFADNYRRLFPHREVYLISKLAEDSTLDSMKTGVPERLDYSTFVDSPPDINTFSNSLVIADDFDTIDGKAGKALKLFLDDIAIMGRKHHENQGNVSLLVLTHKLSDYGRTRVLLNESSHYLLYPQSTAFNQLSNLLEKYIGLTKDDLRRIRRLGRWVLISKNFPQYVMAQHHAEILHTADE